MFDEALNTLLHATILKTPGGKYGESLAGVQG